MTGQRITDATLEQLRVTDKTVWTFVRLSAEDGRIGCGEATLPQRHEALRASADRLLSAVVGKPLQPATAATCFSGHDGLPDAALRSAVDMAIFDILGQTKGVPVWELLGGAQRNEIPLYANINRATTDRAPRGFAETARRAVRHGFTTVKLAPFDEISPSTCDTADFSTRLDQGLARVAATRAAIGDSANLRVDCHWRFTAAAASELITAIAPLKLDWIECPIAEDPQNAGAIAALRAQANRHGIRLAGLEMETSPAAFVPYLETGAYDVIMPDVKYLGGLSRMADLAAAAERQWTLLSPHNPTGPICHAASLHVCAALERVDSLEVQFDETPLFDALLSGPAFGMEGGRCKIPSAPGLGAALDMRCVESLRVGTPA